MLGFLVDVAHLRKSKLKKSIARRKKAVSKHRKAKHMILQQSAAKHRKAWHGKT